MGFPQNGGNLPAGKSRIPSSTQNSPLGTLKGGTFSAKKSFSSLRFPHRQSERWVAPSLPANLMKVDLFLQRRKVRASTLDCADSSGHHCAGTGQEDEGCPCLCPRYHCPRAGSEGSTPGTQTLSPSLAHVSGIPAASMQGKAASGYQVVCWPHLSAIISPPQLAG